MAKKPEKPCQECGKVFQKNSRLSLRQWVATRYCSVECRATADSREKRNARPPLEELFLSSYRVDLTSGCWNWTGAISSQGYGTLRWRGKSFRAHMLSLEMHGEPRPADLNACHRCDNRRCVNPVHLYWGTQKQNVRDAQGRNRLATGPRNTNSKLSPEIVRHIRESSQSHTELAKLYGVSRPAIAAVRNGKNWRHV